MKALFVGLGSIGMRHLVNLSMLCRDGGIELAVHALRSSDRALPEAVEKLIAAQYTQLPEGESYDLAFITNPTNHHAGAIEQLKGRVGAFFIEKPIFETTGHDLEALGLDEGQKAYVAAPMRFCNVYNALVGRLRTTRVFSARALCSSYLPDWRPGADYRHLYSARKDMGGGVALDLIHEWDYMVDLFGPPLQSVSLRGRFSDLEIDSDDLAIYIARYPEFLCELHLDYFGRNYRRELELMTAEGTIRVDFGSGLLALPDDTVEDYSEPLNHRYEREMAYFLSYAAGSEPISQNSPQHALEVLRIALGEG